MEALLPTIDPLKEGCTKIVEPKRTCGVWNMLLVAVTWAQWPVKFKHSIKN